MDNTNNIFQCIDICIDDKMLEKAKIASYLANQVIDTPSGKHKPYAPKSFPDKAVVVQFNYGVIPIQIYFDTKSATWNSSFILDNHIAKLSPEQLDQFFSTSFYKKLKGKLKNIWPLSDPQYANLYSGIEECASSTSISESEANIGDELNEVDQPGKRIDLANKDVDGDDKRDYAGSGRKIVHFSDMGVSRKSAKYFCWPRRDKEFKWSTWKNWKNIKPFAKMFFKHDNRTYVITLPLFDEQFDHRGFRGADYDWKPPFAWITPEECEEALKLTIVQKFMRQCVKRIRPYLKMTPEEIYKKINRPDMITVKEIEKTLRVIKHVVKVVFDDKQIDDYQYDDSKVFGK